MAVIILFVFEKMVAQLLEQGDISYTEKKGVIARMNPYVNSSCA